MIIKILVAFVRLLLKARYKVSYIGFEQLKDQKKVLLLPNHPAEIDPIILIVEVLKYTHIHPVVLERFFDSFIGSFVLKRLKALLMPDMTFDGGFYKRLRIEKTINNAVSILKNDGNILMYPTGHLTSQGLEKIGGNSGTYNLLQNVPDAKIYLVRTTGLRGSSFSRTLTGETPPFFATLWSGAKTILKNFIFFVPKREVKIVIEEIPSFPKDADALTINQELENWYNQNGEESITLIPYSFWSKEVPKIADKQRVDIDITNVSENIKKKIIHQISSITKIEPEKLDYDESLSDDLGMDSLVTAELFAWAFDEFGMTDVDFSKIDTIASLMVAAQGGTIDKPENLKIPTTPRVWNANNIKDTKILIDEDKPISISFLEFAKKHPKAPIIADDLGIFSYTKLLIGAILLAKKFKSLPDEKIGVMLPASSAATLCVTSILLAGKIPVMINWTVGEKNLLYTIDLAKCNQIVTSGKFLDRIEADLTCIHEKFLILEELKTKFSIFEKINALLLSRLSSDKLIKIFDLNKINIDEPAVILFTSGSENVPKGVPLSHKNILSCIKGAVEHVAISRNNVICGFLPPFHSFGFTVTTILPLISGIKIAYHPIPTEGKKIAVACAKWKASIIIGTPTFNKAILKAGTPEMMKALRLVIVGAEKCPEELFKMVKSFPKAEIIEGYGITECSPIVTANIPGDKHLGVGKPLPNVKLLIVNIDNKKIIQDGMGLVLVNGSSVFNGYLGEAPSPFININGEKWYNTGDLGYLKEGNLILTGRLKRFIKIGGEMISLPAIEEVLQKKWQAKDSEPNLAVISRENLDNPQRPLLCLVTTLNITLEDANEELKNGGMSNLMRLSEIQKINSIPMLGSGKTDFQSLHKLYA